jgi:hypothetical protein
METFTINITFPRDAKGAPSHIETWVVPRIGDTIEGPQLQGYRYVVTEVVIDIAEDDDGKTKTTSIHVVVERPDKPPR